MIDTHLFGDRLDILRFILNYFHNYDRPTNYTMHFFNALTIHRRICRWYDVQMNFSNPILICDENEEFRILIRDMLTKNGFFHVIETSGTQEAIEYLRNKKEYLVLVDSKVLNSGLIESLMKQKNFLVFAESSESKTISLAARLGVNHILSYPTHSRKLMKKINSLI